jgi:hypothetical protein
MSIQSVKLLGFRSSFLHGICNTIWVTYERDPQAECGIFDNLIHLMWSVRKFALIYEQTHETLKKLEYTVIQVFSTEPYSSLLMLVIEGRGIVFLSQTEMSEAALIKLPISWSSAPSS